jgi:putative DNA primase/helicase
MKNGPPLQGGPQQDEDLIGAGAYKYPAEAPFAIPRAERAANVVDLDDHRSAEQAAKDLRPVLSEDSIALEYVDRHHEVLRFDCNSRSWHIRHGHLWRRDNTAVASAWTRSLVRAMASDQSPADRRRFGSSKFADGVESFARKDQRIAVTADLWDNDVDVIGTPNGIVDLRTGEMFEPEHELFITRSVAVDPDVTPRCPRWLRFLNETTGRDDELNRYLQRLAGYFLTGQTREQKLAFIQGPGGSGKSTFANTLQNIFGNYSSAAAMETFASSQFDRHPEELARLHGVRLVVANETEAGTRWRENRVKALTGGDMINARFMRSNSFDFRPVFKLLFLGNHAPAISNLDAAIRRRFMVVPFNNEPTEPDLHLEETLAQEFPGILRWALNGAVDWYANGLVLPKAITEATTQYFDEQNIFGQWLDEGCDVDLENPHLMEKSVDLFASWSGFAKLHGEMPGTPAMLNSKLRSHGLEPAQIKALGTKGCRGIRLKLASLWQDR